MEPTFKYIHFYLQNTVMQSGSGMEQDFVDLVMPSSALHV